MPEQVACHDTLPRVILQGTIESKRIKGREKYPTLMTLKNGQLALQKRQITLRKGQITLKNVQIPLNKGQDVSIFTLVLATENRKWWWILIINASIKTSL